MESSEIIIETVNDGNLVPYCSCLEEWSPEIKEAGDLKYHWYEQMKEKGLGVLIAKNPRNEHVGMIQYLPSEYTNVQAENTYHVFCTWVHAYKGKGVGDQRNQGIGKALLKAAEADIRSRNAAGITAWGLGIPVWMKASWYRKQGYVKTDKNGMAVLMWKPLRGDAPKPVWRKPAESLSEPGGNDKIRVLSLVNGICPGSNIGHERMKKVLKDYGDRIEYEVRDTRTAEAIGKWGIMDGLYINGKAVPLGPPPKEKKLHRILEKELKKMKL